MLALRTGRPVKMVMEYREEFIAGAPRHAGVMRLKTGVKRDGTMVAHEMEAFLDAGAYGGFRPGRGDRRHRSRAAAVIAPPMRAFRFRASTPTISPVARCARRASPRACFAAESHIDCVARKVGMDPAAFRLKNLMVEGDETLTGSHYKDIKAKETLAAALKSVGLRRPKAKNVGRGVAMGYRGPGGGNTAMKISLEPDGSIVIHTGLFEQGTGTYTTIRQIAAEELRCQPESIRIDTVDTDLGVSFDSGIGGSRGTRVASSAAYTAACDAREKLLVLAEKLLGWPKAEIALEGGDADSQDD